MKAFKTGGNIIATDIRPSLVDTAMAKGDHVALMAYSRLKNGQK